MTSAAIDVELIGKIRITTGLEDATQLERPGDIFLAEEEIAHLHGIACHPVEDDAGTKPFAGFGGVIFEDLWDREDGFDGEAEGAEEGDVELGIGERVEDDLD